MERIVAKQKGTVQMDTATPSERQEALNALNGLSLNEIMLKVKKSPLVKKQKDRKTKQPGHFYGRNNIDNLTRSQLIDILMEELTGKYNFESDNENQGHALQQEVDILTEELKTSNAALIDYKKKATAESKVKDDKIAELENKIKSMNEPTTVFEDVRKFTAMSKKIKDRPQVISEESYEQIKLFISDEFTELGGALDKPNEVADWIVDHIYYVLDWAGRNGYNLKPIWDLVQEANMRKFPNGKGKFDKNGKVIKPKGWKSNDPQVAEEIDRQIREGAWESE